MNTKYILISTKFKPMIFKVKECAELYQVIRGGTIFAMTECETEAV